jgi:hypothetical protein
MPLACSSIRSLKRPLAELSPPFPAPAVATAGVDAPIQADLSIASARRLSPLLYVTLYRKNDEGEATLD